MIVKKRFDIHRTIDLLREMAASLPPAAHVPAGRSQDVTLRSTEEYIAFRIWYKDVGGVGSSLSAYIKQLEQRCYQ